eukprot:GHVO01030647.1.p1 GENE.GHVO01030647.1~~GHVO01030647.1.p1  ORF type:complete len:248 (+),score=26.78 GHVO01030647.1:60-803(+)
MGDPHCYRFDDENFNREHELFVSQSCSYTMLTSACDLIPTDASFMDPLFTINAHFERVDATGLRSFTKEIHIANNDPGALFWEGIVLKQGLKVHFNSIEIEVTNAVTTIESSGTTVQIISTSDTDNPADWLMNPRKEVRDLVEITFDNGYVVQFDGYKDFKIIAPAGPSFKVCGICGNNDGKRPDMLTGDHQPTGKNADLCPGKVVDAPYQSEAKTDDDLINSWFSETVEEGEDGMCAEECEDASKM